MIVPGPVPARVHADEFEVPLVVVVEATPGAVNEVEPGRVLALVGHPARILTQRAVPAALLTRQAGGAASRSCTYTPCGAARLLAAMLAKAAYREFSLRGNRPQHAEGVRQWSG